MPTASPAPVSASDHRLLEEVATDLSEWFPTAKRTLPWRQKRTPYRVWLSEIMLQQTQVAVVERYFAAFTNRFPTVIDLANASEDEVLSMWAGLGYYARGRNLHRAAKAVRDDHAGEFPDTAAGLQTLPGVGPYTAGAIASLAFGRRAPIVDGNVFRVLSRLFDDNTPIDSSAGKNSAWARAKVLVDVATAPAVVNESMMELGALICSPRSPKCGACPLSQTCRAHAAGTAAALPVKEKKIKRKAMRLAAVVFVTADDRVWLEKQKEPGLFGGLYSPPTIEVASAKAAAAAAQALASERGLPFEPTPRAVIVKRTLTHRDLTFSVFVRHVGGGADAKEWHHRSDLDNVGIAAAARAVLDATWPNPAEDAPKSS